MNDEMKKRIRKQLSLGSVRLYCNHDAEKS